MTARAWCLDIASKFSPWPRRYRKITGAAAVYSISPRKKNKRHSGQATVEYVLVLAMIGVVALGITEAMNTVLQSGITKFTAVLEKDLSTGSYGEKFDQWRMTE